jgi:predicted Zn-dependent protease
MIVSRFLGDRALDYFGPARLVQLGGYLGGSIWGIAMLIAIPMSDTYPIPALVIVNIGFIAAGLGIGPMFPAFILAASKTRYEASKIIEKYNSNKNVLLLTDVDIVYFDKIKNIKEYGIIGLGLRPGKTCVVSTFRIKNAGQEKLLDRLKKVSIHEVGHNLGIDHCNYDIECLMNDARGTVKQIDRERVWLCDNCRKIIGMK